MRSSLLLFFVVFSQHDVGQAAPPSDTRYIEGQSESNEHIIRHGMIPVASHVPNYNYFIARPQRPMLYAPHVLQPVKHMFPGRENSFSWFWEFYFILKLIRNSNANRERTTPTTASPTGFTSARSRFDFTEWYRSKNGCRYKLYKEKEDFLKSKSLCEAVGARLAVKGMRGVDDAATQIRNDILVFTGTIDAGDDSWIGLADLDEDSIFHWIDGVTALKTGPNQNTAWDDSEPTGGARKSCGRAKQNEIDIFDHLCSNEYYRLCEYCP